MSFAVKSVSGADDEIQNVIDMGPVTSTASVSGGVWKTRTSCLDARGSNGSSLPKIVDVSTWSYAPTCTTGVSLVMTSRGRLLFARYTKAEMFPPIVGTG